MTTGAHVPAMVAEKMADPTYCNVMGRRWGGDKYRGKLALPEHVHPVVRKFFAALNAQRTTMIEAAERSGVCYGAIKYWRHKASPSVQNLDAALNVVGLRLAVVPAEVTDADLADVLLRAGKGRVL